MRALVDIVHNMTSTVRFIMAALVLGGIVIALLMVGGVSIIAPQVADNYGERAERLGERAIEAAQEEARAQALAEDGWGYSEPGAGETSSRDSDGDAVGGWGD